MDKKLPALEFTRIHLDTVARVAGEHDLTLYACVSDRNGHVASVAQLGREGDGAASVAWMMGVEADRRHPAFFLVLMRRWGDPDLHTYAVGVFQSLVQAQDEGEKEVRFRGGKYTPEIWQVPLGVSAATKWAAGEWPFQVVQKAERTL